MHGWLIGRRPVLLSLPGALLAGLLGACGQAGGGASEAPPPPPPDPVEPATLVEVRRGEIVESIIVNGQLTAARDATLFFRQSGRLKNLVTSSSERVKAGQVLAEMDSGNLGADVKLAELTMAKAQVKLEQARATLTDRFAVQAAQLDYEAARLTYQQLRQRLAEATLAAPFDGLVTDTSGRPGEAVAAFAPVVKVADLSALRVTAQLNDAADTARLAIGQKGTFILDKLPNVKIPVQVVQLPTTAATLPSGTPVPGEVSRRFILIPTQPLPKESELGMLGRLTLVLREKSGVLLVKSTAVRALGPRRYVQVLQGGRKRDVDVEVGVMTTVDTEIVAGLGEGDRVVDGPPAPPPPASAPARKGG